MSEDFLKRKKRKKGKKGGRREGGRKVGERERKQKKKNILELPHIIFSDYIEFPL